MKQLFFNILTTLSFLGIHFSIESGGNTHYIVNYTPYTVKVKVKYAGRATSIWGCWSCCDDNFTLSSNQSKKLTSGLCLLTTIEATYPTKTVEGKDTTAKAFGNSRGTGTSEWKIDQKDNGEVYVARTDQMFG